MTTRSRFSLAALLLGAVAACSDGGPVMPVADTELFDFALGSRNTHPAGDLGARITLAGRPFAVAVAGGAAYVTQLDVNALSRIDLASLTVTGTTPVGWVPSQVRVAPKGDVAYVGNQDDPSIGIVDLGTFQQTRTIPVPTSVLTLGLSPDGRRIVAPTDYSGVHIFDAALRAHVAQVPFGPILTGIAFNPRAPLVYVAARDGGSVAEIDMRTNTLTRTFNTGGSPQNVAASPAGRFLYVADIGRSQLQVWNLRGGRLEHTVTLGSGSYRNAFDVALTPDGRQLYVSLLSDGAVVVLNRRTLDVVKTIPTGGAPRYIAFDRSGARAYVTNESGWVDVIR